MTPLSLSWPGGPLRGTGHLPASKSEANRALLLRALAGGGTIGNLSDAHDTVLMQRLLTQAAATDLLDAEDAGTVMRFMTAYLAATGWRGLLTGAPRMRQRPIAVLVDALRELGADVAYVDKEGYPPLRFGGGQLAVTGGGPAELTVRGDISSQYISALLLLGPTLPGGLRLRLTGQVGSLPYIELTAALMREFGAGVYTEPAGTIVVLATGYQPTDYAVESDWSAASYWYALVALAAPGAVPPEQGLLLPGLRKQSNQGDQVIQAIMRPLGVATAFEAGGVRLTQVPANPAELLARPLDFSGCPDLAQTVAVVAAARGLPLSLTGLASLRIKETDRIAALQTELARFGAALPEVAPGVFEVQSPGFRVAGQTVATYDDHRMAMAFAPLALRGPLRIENPQVVRKSYPGFWAALAAVGLRGE